MNKLIRDIAIQTDAWCDKNGSVKAAEWEEKFAELIVKETCNIILHYHNVDEGVSVAKMHFGVEE